MSYLNPVLQSSARSRFVRCWHGKTDGWAASTFHSNCDGKGPTVTVIQVGSYIFGGYSDLTWYSSKYHVYPRYPPPLPPASQGLIIGVKPELELNI